MYPQRRRKPFQFETKPGDDPYDLQPISLPSAPAATPSRTAEILTISVITALLVLLGVGIIFWTLENRPARGPTPTPTATLSAASPSSQAALATGIPSPTPREIAIRPSVSPPAAAASQAQQTPMPVLGETPDLRLPIVSLGGAAGATEESATESAALQTPTSEAEAAAMIVSLPFVSKDEVIEPPTPTAESPVIDLTGVAPTQTVPMPPTATPTPPPFPTPYLIDSLKAFVNNASADFFVGPSSIYTQTDSLGVDNEVRLYGRDPSGEWVYACCINNELVWTRQVNVRIVDNTLPGEPEDVEPNDVRWLRVEPARSDLRRLPAITPVPEGDFPLLRFTPDNRGRIQPLPDLSAAVKPWFTEPQAGGSLISPAIVAGSSVVVASSDGHLYSFDRVNGNQRWRTNLGRLVTAAPAFDSGLLYAVDESGVLRALRDLGNATDEEWSRTLSAPPMAPVSGINVFSRTLFINLNQRLVAIDGEDGHTIYDLPLPATSHRPAIGGQLIYVTAGTLRAYDLLAMAEKGQTSLVWEKLSIPNPVAPPVYSMPGVKSLAELYVAGDNERIYSLDANTGNERWNQDNEDAITSLAVNDTAIFISGNGYIRARSRSDGNTIWNRGIAGQALGGLYVDDQRVLAYLQDGSFLYLDAATGEVLASLAAYPAAATAGAAVSRPFVFGPGSDGKLYSFRESP